MGLNQTRETLRKPVRKVLAVPCYLLPSFKRSLHGHPLNQPNFDSFPFPLINQRLFIALNCFSDPISEIKYVFTKTRNRESYNELVRTNPKLRALQIRKRTVRENKLSQTRTCEKNKLTNKQFLASIFEHHHKDRALEPHGVKKRQLE